ncbi:MAG: MarR family transcriptional regulator, partial [Stackebrandtia sp.]
MLTARTSEDLRTHNRIRLLRTVHETGGTLTRSQLTRRLGLARGTASVLVAELHQARLLTEVPATVTGRGRPTRIPGPHPHGPIALTVDVREDGWSLGTAELGGEPTIVEATEHSGEFTEVFGAVATRLRHHVARLDGRVVGAG